MAECLLEKRLNAAREAWGSLESAQATIERLKGYRRMNQDMKRDYATAHERERAARATLTQALHGTGEFAGEAGP